MTQRSVVSEYRAALRDISDKLNFARTRSDAIRRLERISQDLLMNLDAMESRLFYSEYREKLLMAENEFMLRMIDRHMSPIPDIPSGDTIPS